MQLRDEDIKSFVGLYEKEFGVKLEEAEAATLARKLLSLVATCAEYGIPDTQTTTT